MSKKIFNILFISIFSAMLGLGIIAPLLPAYAKGLGATGLWLGIIFAGFSFSRVVFMPIIGRISDKRGRKKFICSGLLLYSLISLLYPLAKGVYSLTVIRLIHGFASSLVVPIAMAYVGETVDKGKEGVSMGTFSMALFLGMGAGPFLGGLLNDTFGINSAFYAMGALTAIAFLISFIFLPDVQRKAVNKQKEKVFSFKYVISNNIIKGMLIFRAVIAMGRGGIMAFLPLFASKINVSPSGIGVIISSNIFLTALLQRPFGMLADKHNKFHLIIVGSSIAALSLIMVSFSRNFWELFFISILMGAGAALAIPSAQALTVKVGKTLGMGVSMGMFNMAMSIGMIAAPLISGIVMDVLGIKFVFYISGVIMFCGAFVFYYYFRKEQKNTPLLAVKTFV